MENPQKLSRPSVLFMDRNLGSVQPVLDHGHIRLIDYMGDEAAVVQAARVSYGLGTDTPEKDVALLRYLMRHRHTTPFEMAEVKLHLKMPIFVARQWVRHRTASINEISGRYTELPREFYVPRKAQIAMQATDNKQGRAEGLSEENTDFVQAHMRGTAEAAFLVYEGFIEAFDLAKELARINLPLSTYTEFYWKIDLHNLLHFLSLRADPHAQYEIRAYADSILQLIHGWMPNVYAAFVDYRLGAHTFSRQEMDALRGIVLAAGCSLDAGLPKVPGLSNREHKAFENALLLPAVEDDEDDLDD